MSLLLKEGFSDDDKEVDSSPSPGSIRFSGTGLSSFLEIDEASGDPLDALLSFLSSDIVSIVFGILGLCIVIFHRLALLDNESADALTLQTRTDLLAVFACGSVLLNGLTKLDVTTALAETVVLRGEKLIEPEFLTLDKKGGQQLVIGTVSWALESLLIATPAKSAVLLTWQDLDDENMINGWAIQCRAGVVPPANSNPAATLVPEKSPILDRVGSPGNTKETYLPTLQALPGRFEFTYLPSNTQLALLIPLSLSRKIDTDIGVQDCHNKVLVLGSDTAKSFSPRDIAWSRVVADRIKEYI